jgi:hypothetical protein
MRRSRKVSGSQGEGSQTISSKDDAGSTTPNTKTRKKTDQEVQDNQTLDLQDTLPIFNYYYLSHPNKNIIHLIFRNEAGKFSGF